MTDLIIKLSQHFECIITTTLNSVGVAKATQEMWIVIQLVRNLVFRNGRIDQSFEFKRLTQVPVCGVKVAVQFQRFAQLIYAFVKTAPVEVSPTKLGVDNE